MPPKINFIKLGRLLETIEDQIKFCQEHFILPKTTNCQKCGKVIQKVTVSGRKVVFRCCESKVSIHKGTILEGSKISLGKFILLT